MIMPLRSDHEGFDRFRHASIAKVIENWDIPWMFEEQGPGLQFSDEVAQITRTIFKRVKPAVTVGLSKSGCPPRFEGSLGT